MDDLIKREDAIDALHKHFSSGFDEDRWWNSTIVLFALNSVPSADRPQGYWTKTDVATYRCSECGKIQIADDVNELNFCCCCGSRNKVRRKGADDE